MTRYADLISQSATEPPEDYIASFVSAEMKRRYTIYRTQRDLYNAATDLGQTTTQADDKIDDLFGTFGGEWSIYIFTGALAITDAILNDTTLPWLDTEYPIGSGVTIRTRLINRLNNG